MTPVGRDDSARRTLQGFALRGEFLSQRWERNQRIAGGDSHRRREQVPSGSSSFSPGPRNLRGPNSRGRLVTVRRGRDNDCPRNRAAVAVGPKSRWAGMLDQTGAPDCSGSNLCGGEQAGGSGIRPYGAISVLCDMVVATAVKPRLSLRNQTGPRKRRRGGPMWPPAVPTSALWEKNHPSSSGAGAIDRESCHSRSRM